MKPAGSDSVVVGVLSFFIVLVIIGIIVMIIFSVLIFICCKRMKVYTANKEIEQYDNEGGHFSSEDHVSKTTPSYENIPGPSNKNLRKTSVSRCVCSTVSGIGFKRKEVLDKLKRCDSNFVTVL